MNELAFATFPLDLSFRTSSLSRHCGARKRDGSMEILGNKAARESGVQLLRKSGLENGSLITRCSFQAASNYALPWRGHSSIVRKSSSRTSRLAIWTSRRACGRRDPVEMNRVSHYAGARHTRCRTCEPRRVHHPLKGGRVCGEA